MLSFPLTPLYGSFHLIRLCRKIFRRRVRFVDSVYFCKLNCVIFNNFFVTSMKFLRASVKRIHEIDSFFTLFI